MTANASTPFQLFLDGVELLVLYSFILTILASTWVMSSDLLLPAKVSSIPTLGLLGFGIYESYKLARKSKLDQFWTYFLLNLLLFFGLLFPVLFQIPTFLAESVYINLTSLGWESRLLITGSTIILFVSSFRPLREVTTTAFNVYQGRQQVATN